MGRGWAATTILCPFTGGVNMSAVVVCRPVNGITINSEMEFVLDGEGCVRIFDSMANARKTFRYFFICFIKTPFVRGIPLAVRIFGT